MGHGLASGPRIEVLLRIQGVEMELLSRWRGCGVTTCDSESFCRRSQVSPYHINASAHFSPSHSPSPPQLNHIHDQRGPCVSSSSFSWCLSLPQWPCRQHHHPPVMTQTQVGHVTLGLSWPEAEMMYSFVSPWSAVFRRRACPGERRVVSSNAVTLARDLPVVPQSDVHCHCPGFLYSALRSCCQLSVQKIMRCPGYF